MAVCWRSWIAPTLGAIQLKHLGPGRGRRWYSTVLSADRPVQRKHAYSLLRSIPRGAEDEGLIDRDPRRVRNAGRDELHQLLEQLPDHKVASLLAIARRAESFGG